MSIKRDLKLTSEQALSAKLTMPNERELRNIFQSFDRDHDDILQPHEMIDVLRGLGLNPTKDECAEICKDFSGRKSEPGEGDENQCPTLNFDEFHQLITAFWTGGVESRMIEAFKTFDKNKSGFIEYRELRNYLMNYGDDRLTDTEVLELVATMVDQADLDFNHKIDYYEFARMLCQSSFKGDADK